MNKELKQAKQSIRPYLMQITDQQLAVLTAMAQDGNVQYSNHCQCIKGIVGGCTLEGYQAEDSKVARHAEKGLLKFGYFTKKWWSKKDGDRHRNLLLYPMCKAEQRRRERVHGVQNEHGRWQGRYLAMTSVEARES